MLHIENLGTRDSNLPAPESIRGAAAAAYQPVSLDTTPKNDKPPERQTGGDTLPPDLQKRIDAIVTASGTDAEKGKFSPESKKAWQDLVDYLKLDKPAVSELNSALKAVCELTNEELAKTVSGVRIGADAMLDNTGANFYVRMDGPNISAEQNQLDIAQGHESDTVIRVGRMDRPKPQPNPAP